MTESQFKKIVQGVCVGAVTVFFIMVLVLIVLFSKSAAIQRNIENLEREIAKAEQTVTTLEEDIEKYRSIGFIELYAREKLGMLKEGEQKFVPKSN